MNKQELYNKIRTRINELVPRLKELSFGCEIKYNNDYSEILITNETEENRSISLYTKNNTVKGIEDISEYEIIGHPIYLEHILEAIERVDNGSCSIDSTGELNGLDSDGEDIYINYNLSLSLENQSLETLEALDKLLN